MKTFANIIQLVRNVALNLYNYKLCKSKGFGFKKMIEFEWNNFKVRQNSDMWV